MGEDEPGWSRALEEILYARQPMQQTDPEPGYFFMRAVNVGMASIDCFSTLAIEEVPPSNNEPSDEEADSVEHWIRSLRPDAIRRSPATPHWQAANEWDSWLWNGPGLSVREVVIVERVPAEGQQPRVALKLRDQVDRWRLLIDGALALMQQLGSHRVRLGLTLATWSAGANPYTITDINFDGLPVPVRWVVPDQIGSWRYVVDPFDSTTFPRVAVDRAIRSLLRNFGYREVDSVLTALGLNEHTG